MDEKEFKEAEAKRKAIAKAKRIKEMKLEPKYPIDIWNKLRIERKNLLDYIKKGDLAKIEETKKIIHSLEIQFKVE